MRLPRRAALAAVAPLAVCVLLGAGPVSGAAPQGAAGPGRAAAPARVAADPVAGVVEDLARLDRLGMLHGTVLLARGDEVLHLEGYGTADRFSGEPFGPDTVSTIGSITKQLTGAAVLALAERGRLRLDDPLSRHLPGVPPDKAAITLHQILTHTAGLPAALGSDEEVIGKQELLARAWAADLLFPPGERHEYSNVGYSVAAAVVEAVSGTAYERFLHDTFFAPLGMRSTGYWLPAWNPRRVAKGYRGDESMGSVLSHQDRERGFTWHLVGNGGIHSTARDMFRWVRALRNHEVLSAESTAKLFGRHADEGGGDSFYGYGWVTFDLPDGSTMIGHDGGNGFFFADLNFFPSRGDLLFFLMTNDAQAMQGVDDRIARRLAGEEVPLPPAAVEASAAELDRLAGSYRLPGGERLEVRPANGRLLIQPASADADAALRASSPEEAARLTERSERIATIVDALLRGDARPLWEAYARRTPLDELTATYRDRLRGFEAEHGRLEGFTVHGTRPLGPETDVTPFTLRYAGGSRDLAYVWEPDGALRGLRMTFDASPTPWWPIGEGGFRSFALTDPEPRTAAFEVGEGDEIALVLTLGERTLRATREPAQAR